VIDVVVFDLDGTLVDSHQDLAFAANALVVELGGTGVSEAAVVKMVGEGAAVLVRRALTASGLDPDTPGALDRFLTIYDTCLLDRTRPYPGMVETLERLQPLARLAVLTNKPQHHTDRLLEALDLRRYFVQALGGDTAQGRKPDPTGLTALIGAAGAVPAAGMLVGDSWVDAETARRGGTRFCFAEYGFGSVPPAGLREGELRIRDFEELQALLAAGLGV